LQDKNTEECVGAFTVTVYDRFGNLEVTNWGKELSCGKAKAIKESADAYHESYEEDFH